MRRGQTTPQTIEGWFGPYVLCSAGTIHDRTSTGMCFPVHRCPAWGCSYECPVAGLINWYKCFIAKMIGLPTWAAWGSASGLSYRLKSLPLGFWSAGVCKMVWLLAGQTYLITCWAVRRWTKSAAAVSAHPCSYRRLIILRLVALCSFSRILI